MTVPEIIIASALLSNVQHVGLQCTLRLYRRGTLAWDVCSCSISSPCLPPPRSEGKRCARWPGRRRCIHKFISLSRTSTESAFFPRNQLTLTHLQDFENCSNTNGELQIHVHRIKEKINSTNTQQPSDVPISVTRLTFCWDKTSALFCIFSAKTFLVPRSPATWISPKCPCPITPFTLKSSMLTRNRCNSSITAASAAQTEVYSPNMRPTCKAGCTYRKLPKYTEGCRRPPKATEGRCPLFLHVTLRNANRFSKIFHRHALQ